MWRSTVAALIGAITLAMGTAGATIPLGVSSLGNAEIKLVGDVPGQGAGFHVGPAGDLDGDGADDVVVGAFLDNTVGPAAGAAYLLYGPLPEGVIDLADADAKLLGEATGDFAAEGWAGVGDLDGDGLDDLVVGAPGRDPALGQPGTAAPGAAYVFYGSRARLGGTMSLAEADAKLLGESDVDFAGLAVASATDLDADGLDDLVVSASRDDAAGSEAGAVYIFYGGGRLSGTVDLADADAKLVGAPQDLAGFRLDRAGDLDGDGFGDLVIGAPSNPGFGGTGVGATYVLYGSADRLAGMSSLPAIAARLVGEEDDDRPGIGLAGAGDLDHDGLDDLIVGADLEDTGGTNAGAAYVFYGSASRLAGTVSLATADAKLVGEAAGDQAGINVAIAGRLDGDPFAELVVGAFGHSASGPAAGAAYVIFGEKKRLAGTVRLADADSKLLGEGAFDFAGFAVGPAGDVNDDGHNDLMVGAFGHDSGTGAVYVLTGDKRVCGRGHGDHEGKHPCDPRP